MARTIVWESAQALRKPPRRKPKSLSAAKRRELEGATDTHLMVMDLIFSSSRLPPLTAAEVALGKSALSEALISKAEKIIRYESVLGFLALATFLSWPLLTFISQWQFDLWLYEIGFTWRTPIGSILATTCTFASLVAAAQFYGRGYRETFIAACVSVTACVAATFVLEQILHVFAYFAIAVACLTGLILLYSAIRHFVPQPGPRHKLLADLASIYIIADTEADNWREISEELQIWFQNTALNWRSNDGDRAEFCRVIAQTATRAESSFPSAVGPMLAGIRSPLRQLAVRIGTRLRELAAEVALGGHRDESIVDDVGVLLINVCLGRWDQIASTEPPKPIERFLRKFGVNMLLAIGFLAAGILIPQLFREWIGDAETQIRIILFSAAALSLIDSPRSAFKKAGDIFQGR